MAGVGSGGSATGNVGSGTSTSGAGATARSEDIDLSVAAVVTEVLPNGNLMASAARRRCASTPNCAS